MIERYYVKVSGMRGPQAHHNTLTQAYTEARRLYDLNGRTRRVYVLQAVGAIEPELEGAESRTTAVVGSSESHGKNMREQSRRPSTGKPGVSRGA